MWSLTDRRTCHLLKTKDSSNKGLILQEDQTDKYTSFFFLLLDVEKNTTRGVCTCWWRKMLTDTSEAETREEKAVWRTKSVEDNYQVCWKRGRDRMVKWRAISPSPTADRRSLTAHKNHDTGFNERRDKQMSARETGTARIRLASWDFTPSTTKLHCLQPSSPSPASSAILMIYLSEALSSLDESLNLVQAFHTPLKICTYWTRTMTVFV